MARGGYSPVATVALEAKNFKRRLLTSAATLLLLALLGIAAVLAVRATWCRRTNAAGQSLLQGQVDLNALKAELPASPVLAAVDGATKNAADGVLEGLGQDPSSDPNDPDNLKHARDLRLAQCVLGVMQTAEIIAKLGANLKAVADTCNVTQKHHLHQTLQNQLCAVNVQFVAVDILTIANGLAAASSTCAEVANVDAQCTAACVGLVKSLEGVALSAQILQLACERAAKLHKIGHVIELGNNSFGDKLHQIPTSALATNIGSQPAPAGHEGGARRLFLGAGPKVRMMQCVLDVVTASTVLALMGTTLDAAIHNGDCPAKVVSGKAKPLLSDDIQKELFGVNTALCNLDISKVLISLAHAASLLSMTPVHCARIVDLSNICGVGATSLVSSLVGIGATSSAIYLTCDVPRRKIKEQIQAATQKAVQQASIAAAQQELGRHCPNLTLPCANALRLLEQPCAGGVNATCPVWPNATVCPGIESCLSDFTAMRPSLLGQHWPPRKRSRWSQGGRCYTYVACLLQKVNTRFPSTSRRLGEAEVEEEVALRALEPEPGSMEEADALWQRIGYNLTDLADQDLNWSVAPQEVTAQWLEPSSSVTSMRERKHLSRQGHWSDWIWGQSCG
eukprot:gb/GFBE01081373.1/.p1 GENE.gb/GFBE01081373.1/~~gb/GFBE01081373.1/.p1  ORF type:complete len:622 (+),score=89.82 gb/GFBE01081373.1/:1-1866(+)